MNIKLPLLSVASILLRLSVCHVEAMTLGHKMSAQTKRGGMINTRWNRISVLMPLVVFALLLCHARAIAYPRDIAPVEPTIQFPGTHARARLKETTALIRADLARSTYGVDGSGLTVAVIDTGLRTTHIDFAGRVVAQHNWTADNGGNANDATDGYGHGTNVGGIIVAHGNHTGIAPGAKIIPLKVIPDHGGGSFASVESALQWVIDNRATYNITVVNMSLGDEGDYVSYGSDSIESKIQTLRNAKVAVVVAAGNKYYSHGSQQGMQYPAIFPETVSCGAVYDTNIGGGWCYGDPKKCDDGYAYTTAADRICPFSQRLHPTVQATNRTDIFAPGAILKSSGITDDYGESEMQGTSQAAPVISGVILLMQQCYQQRYGYLPSVDSLENWLRAGAVTINDGDDENDNVGHTGKDFLRVDAVNAIKQIPDAVCTDNNASFVSDVTVPDGTTFNANVAFTKTWRIKNNGSCSWGSGYKWTFDGGDKMSGPDSIDVPNISPGSTWDPSVNLTAPGSAGTYRGYWRMQAPNGTKFGTQVWVQINVQGGCTSNNAVFKAPPGNTGAQTLPEFNDYGWVQRGQTFPITFYAYNTGDCTWPSGSNYCLHHNAAAPSGPMQWCETVDWTCAPQNAWTKTLGITASQTPGTYRVTARMMKAGTEFGNYVNWDFHVNSPPGKPTLTGPGNGSTVYGPTVAFAWNDPGDADNGPRNSRDYVLEVFNSGGTKILGTDWIFDRSFSYTLPGPGTYSWRVHAGDGLDVSDWSDQWSFTYSNKGTLTISTNTNTPCGLNAEVLVNGTSWGTAPQSRTLDAGTYTVSFGAVAGWNTPGNQSATVTAGQTTSIVGTYGDAGLPDITITQSPTANTCIAGGQVCYTASDAQCGTPTVTYAWDSGAFSATPASGCVSIPDGTHTLHLHAVDSVGNARDVTAGPFSVDATPPAAPTGLAATLDHYTATLTWTAADSTGCAAVAGYNVYRKRSDGGGYAKVSGALVTDTKFTDSAANGVAYDYGVTAVDVFNREGSKAELKSQVVGKRGDLNGDGQIDITDVIALINLINRGNLTPVEQALGDYNSDGKVDANDVEAMKKFILGK